jgi:hypothetical protein
MIARLLFLLLVQMSIAGHAFAEGITEKNALRYHGVYVSKPFVDDEAYCELLRFYPGGTVITVSSVCDRRDLKDIKKWFSAKNAGRNHSGVSRGKFRIKGDRISFAAVSREGKVNYQGHITGDQLRLHSHSHINGNKDKDSYSFVQW